MKLSDLLDRICVLEHGVSVDPEVHRVSRDSRDVDASTLFVAIEGAQVDGHLFVGDVDAAAVIVSRSIEAAVPWVRVSDTRRALAQCAAALSGDPAERLKMVGVTGTNGKTTLTSLVDEALLWCGRRSARIGTTGTRINGTPRTSALTTPGPVSLHKLLAEMVDAEVESVCMEVSSIGLDQARVEAIRFHTALFTNLSGDHLDYHGTMADYAAAKARLFTDHLRPPGGMPRAILNGDDPAWQSMDPPSDRWTYGKGAHCDLRIETLHMDRGGLGFVAQTPLGAAEIRSPMVGGHNAANLLGALGVMLTLGISLERAAQALSHVRGVRGRLESVENQRGILVLVDYAHSDDALARALATCREVSPGTLWVVFGAGGDRDRAKRPRMGLAAERGADRVVVTSDNPRSEDPQSIVDEILSGMSSAPAKVELDRRAAIHWVIENAMPGDTVLIAGKGHEDTQEIRGVKHPFDDRDVALEAL